MNIIKIGRAATNDFVVDDQSVSRSHCEIKEVNDGTGTYLLEDLDSSYGTYVNGANYTKKIINKTDQLKFGNSSIFTINEITEALKRNNSLDYSKEFREIKKISRKKTRKLKMYKDNLQFARTAAIILSVSVVSFILNDYFDSTLKKVIPVFISLFLVYISIKVFPKVQDYYMKKLNKRYSNKLICPNTTCNQSLETGRGAISKLEKCPYKCGAKFI